MIDHVVWIVPSLEDATREMKTSWGVEPAIGGKHPAHATHNMLLRLGPRTYLEILATDPDADPTGRSARGDMVAAVADARLHEALLNVADFDAATAAANHGPYRVNGVFPGERHRPDGSAVQWRRAELETAGGTKMPDVIEWAGDHPASTLPEAASLRRLTLRVGDPDDMRTALAVLGPTDDIDVAGGDGLTLEIETPNGTVTL